MEENIIQMRYYEDFSPLSSSGTNIKPSLFLIMIITQIFIYLSLKSSKKYNFRMIFIISIFLTLNINGFITIAHGQTINNDDAPNYDEDTIEQLRIAGFYPLSGYLSKFGSSCEAITRVAVNNLNENFLHDKNYEIIFKSYDTSSVSSQGIRSLSTAREDFNMFGILGAFDDLTSSSMALSSTLYLYPQISYGSRANSLSNRTEYPLFARVIPPYNAEGKAISLLIQLYGWKNIGVIYSGDDYGVPTFQSFEQSIISKDIEITSVQYTAGDKRLDSQMQTLRNSICHVIVMFPSTIQDARTILLEAYRYHLIDDNFIWFSGSFASDSSLFYDEDTKQTNYLLKGIASGLTSIKLKGGYGDPFHSFLDEWETLDPKQYSGSGKRSLPLITPYAYDSMDIFVKTFFGGNFEDIFDFFALMKNLTFIGLTGPIEFDSNMNRLAIFDIVNLVNNDDGDHGFIRVGSWFESNSQSNQTQMNENTFGFEFDYKIRFHDGSTQVPDIEVRPKVEYWSCDDHKKQIDLSGKIKLDPSGPDAENIAYFYHCDSFIDCKNFSDESYDCSSSNFLAVFIVFGIITGILICIAILLIPFVIIFGFFIKRIRVRTASPIFLLIIIISIIIGYCSIFSWYGQPNSVACGFQPWLLGLSIHSLIAALCAKNLRIWKIFKTPLKRKKISDSVVILVWFILLIPAVFLLFLWTLISTPTATLVERGDNHLHYVCDTGGFTGPPGGIIFFSIFVSYSGIVLLFGSLVSFLTRNVPSLFNESKLIAISTYNLVILGAIIIPVFFVLLEFNPFIGWIIRTLAILYAFTATLYLMFIPKVWGLLKDRFQDPESYKSQTFTKSGQSGTSATFDA